MRSDANASVSQSVTRVNVRNVCVHFSNGPSETALRCTPRFQFQCAWRAQAHEHIFNRFECALGGRLALELLFIHVGSGIELPMQR